MFNYIKIIFILCSGLNVALSFPMILVEQISGSTTVTFYTRSIRLIGEGDTLWDACSNLIWNLQCWFDNADTKAIPLGGAFIGKMIEEQCNKLMREMGK